MKTSYSDIHHPVSQLHMLRSDADALACEEVDVLLALLIGQRCGALQESTAREGIVVATQMQLPQDLSHKF